MTMPSIQVRPECPADVAGVRAVLCAAFPTDAEARLVERLRASRNARVALVTEADGRVVGHVMFSPVTVEHAGSTGPGLGMAPVAVAVAPEFQRQGMGSRLVEAGLAAARGAGHAFAVVLGWPDY